MALVRVKSPRSVPSVLVAQTETGATAWGASTMSAASSGNNSSAAASRTGRMLSNVVVCLVARPCSFFCHDMSHFGLWSFFFLFCFFFLLRSVRCYHFMYWISLQTALTMRLWFIISILLWGGALFTSFTSTNGQYWLTAYVVFARMILVAN